MRAAGSAFGWAPSLAELLPKLARSLLAPDAASVLDRLDVKTAGGIREVLDAIHAIAGSASAPREP